MKSLNWKRGALLTFVAAALVAALVAALSAGALWTGWLAAMLLAWPALLALWVGWQWAGAGRTLAWMVTLAFVLRLGGGIALSLALPVAGYDEPVQKAGYVFFDAHRRDTQSWQIALAGEPLWKSFRREFASDQYGGMFAMSALIYRYLSPDAHRPYLILILTAFFTALGAIFLWRGIAQRWDERLANLTTWIFVLYPESILLGCSQMREPFLLGLSAVAFWAVLTWKQDRRAALAAFVLSLGVMALISPLVAAPMAGVLVVWFLIENPPAPYNPRLRVWVWILLGLAALAALFLSWEWLRSAVQLDAKLTWISSGRVQKAIEEVGVWARLPFILVYGLVQPVLPAAIADDALPLWRGIAIARAAGWYALAPLLLYGVFAIRRAQPRQERRIWVWLALVVVVWTMISSLRAGGDQWDNPRYRSMFLVWLALFAAWAVQRRDAWLWRWLAVEAVFLGFFTNWYISRYYQVMGRLPFWEMVAWIVALSVLILAGGWGWDRWRARRRV